MTTKIPKCLKRVFPNGVKLLVEKMPAVRSIAIGLIVGTGSGHENKSEMGISHFIEHMIFKGTPKRNAFQIAAEVDAVGGRINAYTAKEYTSFYSMVIDEHLDIAIDILMDIFLNSSFDAKEMEIEKGVVLQEIKMYDDTPDELIHDLFAETIFHEHPIGYPTLGTKETVKFIEREDIMNFRRKFYQPNNLIISVAGDADYKYVMEKIMPYFENFTGKAVKTPLAVPEIISQIKIKSKKTEQVHLCLGVKGISHLDPDRYTFALLENILGGSMSSRLFQEIREKRGLAYNVFSYLGSFVDFGFFSVYAGTSKDNYRRVVDLILREFSKIKKTGVSDEELSRAREYLKGNLVLGLESTSARMSWMAKSELYYNRVLTVDEIFAEVDKITRDDIVKIAEKYFRDPYLNLATIGDLKGNEIKMGDLHC